MGERKAIIKNADMSEEMQADAIECATQVGFAFERCAGHLCFRLSSNSTWNATLRRLLKRNSIRNTTQHGIASLDAILVFHVADRFQSRILSLGSFVTHETKHFVYFYLGKFLSRLQNRWFCRTNGHFAIQVGLKRRPLLPTHYFFTMSFLCNGFYTQNHLSII